ncbi:nucleotidyltransferase [Paracoccus litorisediminis]|uniref:nucleotidyltransferase domain-containing protein n=1 Tax=Paracoccus litorisediminis TaxID=2006130 RepID=UPI00372DFD86
MNKPSYGNFRPFTALGEHLLASTAIKIELPPSQHALMVQRKAAIEKHLEREGSSLRGLIRLFYQQGSVAIGATIRAKFRQEGFDIDIIVELLGRGSLTPAQVLDLLYEAMRGEPGSRYYDCTERQSRCVTVYYADGMHLDLSPAVLLDERDPRRSHIFHSKLEEPRWKDTTILTNCFGFVAHYNERCPIDQMFAEDYGRLVRDADLQLQVMMKDADSVPVPVHSTIVGGKSAVTVALQLLKRNRNIRWLPRNRRMPASVMFSCLSLEVAEAGRTIGQNLKVIAEHILDRLIRAKSAGELLHVENPVCRGDVFTDRWPVDHTDQDLLIGDMRLLLRQLAELFDDRRSFKDRSKTLEDMFGETVAKQVVDAFAVEMGQSVRSGSHLLGATGGILAAPTLVSAKPAAPRNTFYGTKWSKS